MASLKSLTAFSMDSGFIWGPSPELYGGVAGFYEYGPMGKLLKTNVENIIRTVFRKHDFWEVECPTILPAPVWKASGHLDGFTDPMIQCSQCSAVFRVDTLIEDHSHNTEVKGLTNEQLLELIAQLQISCLTCNGALQQEITAHDLMMKTTIGVDTEAYNRPETATATYLPFKRYDDFFRHKYPFGVFQIGKAYRNEISPRQLVMRGREFTQAEAQLFLFSEQKHAFDKYEFVKETVLPLWSANDTSAVARSLQDAISSGLLKNKAYAWALALAYELFIAMGIPAEKIRIRQHHPSEMAFYADDAWDIEIELSSYGWYEVCGVHDRTSYDLQQHGKAAKQNLFVFNDATGKKEIPHIIEIAFGTDRPTFALLDIFYDDTNAERRVLRLPPQLAPIHVGVFPLLKNKPQLVQKAREVYDLLHNDFICHYDEAGSIGKRYARHDEKGTPLGVTIDFDTLEDDTVTLRNRDDSKQIRVNIKDLVTEVAKVMKNDLGSFA